MGNQAQEPCDRQNDGITCTNVSTQYADMSVPVRLKPYAIVGEVETECCGDAVITQRQCQGSVCPCGCEMTITQAVCIHIPIEYGTNAEIGDTVVVCKKTSGCNTPPCR